MQRIGMRGLDHRFVPIGSVPVAARDRLGTPDSSGTPGTGDFSHPSAPARRTEVRLPGVPTEVGVPGACGRSLASRWETQVA
jgi:hypothetical protein